MPGVSFTIWSVLIIIGAAQAFFLFVSLFFGKQNRKANRLLALLLLLIALHLAEYAIAITGLSLQFPHSIASTYPLLYCMGPLYLLYIRSALQKEFSFKPGQLLHFILPLVCLFLLLPFYTLSGQKKIEFMFSLAKEGEIEIPVSQFVFMLGHILQTFVYVYLSGKIIRKQEMQFKEQSSNTQYGIKTGFLKKFNSVFFSWLIMYSLLVIILFISRQNHVEIDYVSLLITSILMYIIGYAVLNNPAVFHEMVVLEERLTVQKEEVMIEEEVKYKKSLLPGEKAKQIKELLEKYFTQKKPYLEYDIKLPDVAGAINVSTQQLSQVINKEYSLNFYDFVNGYRVEEAKKLLTSINGDRLKVLAIAFEVGFNSKATFNRVFKKFTMLTPTEYKERFSVDS